MHIQDQSDTRLILSEKDGGLPFVYLFMTALALAIGLAFHLWGDIAWPAYLGFAVAVSSAGLAVLARNSWHRLILDRQDDRVTYTRKRAIGRATQSLPLSAVHSVVATSRDIRLEASKSTVHRVVIRPVEGSGHHAIGFLTSERGAARVAKLCSAWLGTDADA